MMEEEKLEALQGYQREDEFNLTSATNVSSKIFTIGQDFILKWKERHHQRTLNRIPGFVFPASTTISWPLNSSWIETAFDENFTQWNTNETLCIKPWCNETSSILDSTSDEKPFTLPMTIFIGICLSLCILLTIFGNLLVLLAFICERAIRQPSNYFLASLAITDVLIGSVSMPFYTVYVLVGYWDLGPILCDLWLSVDYTVCLVSQFTVLLITIDRFCSVKVAARYRAWRTDSKVLFFILLTWIVPALLFFISIFGWEHFIGYRDLGPRQCAVQFLKDPVFNTSLIVGYYWIPLIILFTLYGGIYQTAYQMAQKSKLRKKQQQALMNMKSKTQPKQEPTNVVKCNDLPKIQLKEEPSKVIETTKPPKITMSKTESTLLCQDKFVAIDNSKDESTAVDNRKSISSVQSSNNEGLQTIHKTEAVPDSLPCKTTVNIIHSSDTLKIDAPPITYSPVDSIAVLLDANNSNSSYNNIATDLAKPFFSKDNIPIIPPPPISSPQEELPELELGMDSITQDHMMASSIPPDLVVNTVDPPAMFADRRSPPTTKLIDFDDSLNNNNDYLATGTSDCNPRDKSSVAVASLGLQESSTSSVNGVRLSSSMELVDKLEKLVLSVKLTLSEENLLLQSPAAYMHCKDKKMESENEQINSDTSLNVSIPEVKQSKVETLKCTNESSSTTVDSSSSTLKPPVVGAYSISLASTNHSNVKTSLANKHKSDSQRPSLSGGSHSSGSSCDRDHQTSDHKGNQKEKKDIFRCLGQKIKKKKKKNDNEKKSKSENRANKALKTISVIMGAFVACWTPYHIIAIMESFCLCTNSHLYMFFYFLCYANSPINPFCYALANQQFKKTFYRLLKGDFHVT